MTEAEYRAGHDMALRRAGRLTGAQWDEQYILGLAENGLTIMGAHNGLRVMPHYMTAPLACAGTWGADWLVVAMVDQ